MNYVELPPPPTLRNHVQCVWRLRAEHPAAAEQTIYPDGRCELIAHLGPPMRRYTLDAGWQTQTNCVFAAQMRSAIRLAADVRVDCVGVRLQPAASGWLLGNQLASMVDEIVDVRTLAAEFTQAFIAACAAFATTANPAELWTMLDAQSRRLAIDLQIARVIEAIDAERGDVSVKALAESRAMSMRSLQTRFLRAVGLTAKEYARVQRLQATLRELDRDVDGLSGLAVDAGFSDQAHATREVQRLTGLTPAKLRRALRAERAGDATLRMAAAFIRGRKRGEGDGSVDGSVIQTDGSTSAAGQWGRTSS